MSIQTYKNKSDIRVGVIGYGGAFNMGRAHLELARRSGMTPTAVIEKDSERLSVAGNEFPDVQLFETLEAALDADVLDLVTIITPHNTHAPLALQCLKAGKHVICEKPLAITTDDCDEMIRVAGDNNLLLSTFHNRHWDGCILEAHHQIIENKIIGEIVRVEAHMGAFGQPLDWWRSSLSISGGIHYDWGVHLLEYAFQLVDSNIIEVSGFKKTGVWQTKWGDDSFEDEVSAIGRFENGVLLNLRITQLDAAPSAGQIKVVGTKGAYVLDQEKYQIYKHEGEILNQTTGKNRPGRQEKYYENIADTLIGEDRLIITPEWSRRPIEVLWLATQSANQNRTLRTQ